MGKISLEEKYMREAIRQAKKALVLGEVPIGCVIEYQGKIIGRGYNRRMIDKTVLAHAEIIAIRKACRRIGDWRLEGCTMYVTLEPCPMCAGAIVQARIPKVVIDENGIPWAAVVTMDAVTTGPANGPRPTSSIPAIKRWPFL